MTLHRKYLFAILGVAALCVATSSFSLTLGRAKGAVNIGQPLKLVVPVQTDAGEGSSALCFEAEVFYGDTRQDASRVVISSDWYPQSQSANVVVSSSGAVDEPVVTVYLRAACESKAARRYVLLSELAATVTPSTQTANSPAVALSDRAAQAAVPRMAAKDAEPLVAVAKPKKATPYIVAPRAASANPSASSSTKERGRRAQLKLAPLDLTPEFDPTLKVSNDLVVEVSEDLQKRAQSVALWDSLNVTPQAISSAESMRHAMALDFKNLQSITVKNGELLQDMTKRLDKADAGRYFNPLVYVLFLSITAICFAIAVLWSRTCKIGLAGEPWWRDDIAGDKSETIDFTDSGGSQSRTAHKEVDEGRAPVLQSVPSADVPPRSADVRPPPLSKLAFMDIDLEIDDLSALSRSIPPSGSVRRDPVQPKPSEMRPRASGQGDFGHSMSAVLLRSINTKEMLDVRQQAEFFMTLGQHEEAIALLTKSVDGEADANPLVHLELLKVLHTLGLKAEYDHYRQRFNTIFNGHVPIYAGFHQVGRGLEAYPAVCQQIVALWPSAAAVRHIENSLVRAGIENGEQDFELEAFRDLLMLHGVASRIASATFDSGFVAFSAAKTAPIPVFAVPNANLDFDLSQEHDGNLIDFDASDWSPSVPGDNPGKTS